MIEGVDYAWSQPSPTGLAKAGKKFAVRYGGPGSSGKQLDLAEARALSAAGLSIVANAEGTAGGLRGRAAGAAWAQAADTHFRSCGMPPDRPIYLSVDWDVTRADWPAVADALRGAASVLGAGRVGIYGGYNAITWAQADRVAAWYWQTYGWSAGRWAPGVHIQQYRNGVQLLGADCDLNRALVNDYGQWTVGGTPSAAPTEEDDVLTNAQDGALSIAWQAADALLDGQDVTDGGKRAVWLVTTLKQMQAQITQLAAAQQPVPQPIDYDALAKALLRNMAQG